MQRSETILIKRQEQDLEDWLYDVCTEFYENLVKILGKWTHVISIHTVNHIAKNGYKVEIGYVTDPERKIAELDIRYDPKLDRFAVNVNLYVDKRANGKEIVDIFRKVKIRPYMDVKTNEYVVYRLSIRSKELDHKKIAYVILSLLKLYLDNGIEINVWDDERQCAYNVVKKVENGNTKIKVLKVCCVDPEDGCLYCP